MRDQQTTATHLAALQQRRNQLDATVTRAENLVKAARVVRSAGVSVPAVPDLEQARQATTELRERYKQDPQSVRAAGPSGLDAPVKPMEALLRERWSGFAEPKSDAIALAELLAFLPQFRDAQKQIERLCDRLAEAARTMPKSLDDIKRVTEWKHEVEQRINALKEEGLDTDVQRFLRESAFGVPLNRLLAQSRVLEFLRTHNLLSSLTVSFRANTPKVTR